jgi:hypothetical protein
MYGETSVVPKRRLRKAVQCIDPLHISLIFYTSPSSVLPYIPLRLSRHSAHSDVGSDNHLTAFANDSRFGQARGV